MTKMYVVDKVAELKRNLLLIYSFCIKNLYSTFTFCKTVLSTLIKAFSKWKDPSCLLDILFVSNWSMPTHASGSFNSVACVLVGLFLTSQLRRRAGSSDFPTSAVHRTTAQTPSPTFQILSPKQQPAGPAGTKPCPEGHSLCCHGTPAP